LKTTCEGRLPTPLTECSNTYTVTVKTKLQPLQHVSH